MMIKHSNNLIAVIGLAIGALFGVVGGFFSNPTIQIGIYEISSIGLTAACVLLAVKYMREKEDYLATGFLLLAIAEAVMTAGASAGAQMGQASFGAGMALYVPSFLFISLPKKYPIWTRLPGLLATIPFTLAATQIFMGEEVLSTSTLPGVGYGLLTLTIIGWIIALLREKSKS